MALVEAYTKAVGLFHDHGTPDPLYSETLELDMATVEPSLAGPKRPQDRVQLSNVKRSFAEHLEKPADERGFGLPKEALASRIRVERADDNFELEHGSVIIAAITSCTNTSNPSVMLGAGLLAKKAVEAGLKTKSWVKSSLAPGSKVVTDYLDKSGLMPFLEALRFHLVGYGCTTCIGNSGPLPTDIASAVDRGDLVAAAVLSGNRNFEGRVNPGVKANYLASPMLVVAYALAGTMKVDLVTEPLGIDPNGRAVYLKDIWPTQEEILATVRDTLDPQMFKRGYATVFQGDARWQSLEVPKGEIYNWDPASTYVQEPPFFVQMPLSLEPVQDIEQARVLAVLGDSLTTDHISPAGAFAASSPAGRYLTDRGVQPADFNSYGSRRGNHEVMMRGSFANIRIKNQMLPGVEGGYTKKLPGGEQMPIYDAAMAYQHEGTPLIIIGGKEYGTGSSRDWAAKGTLLLGVKAVIAESFERIHRSNLVGMGVLPLVFKNGQNAASLGLNGEEIFNIQGLGNLRPSAKLEVIARKPDGAKVRFWVIARLDTLVEVDYYNNGGILQTVLRRLVKEDQANK